MIIPEFEQMETFKAHVIKRFKAELLEQIGNLKISPNDMPRDGRTPENVAACQDQGYHHGISQVQALLTNG